jgi:hypothetical protein
VLARAKIPLAGTGERCAAFRPDLIASRRSSPSAHQREPPLHPVFSAGLPAILPEFVRAVSASTVATVATTAAGAEALLACEG